MKQRIVKTRLQLAIQAIFLGTPIITGLLVSHVAHAEISARHFDIPANTLAQVLQQFAIESKLTLAYEPSTLITQQSSGLKGTYSIEQGLQNLLTPHGLQAVQLENGGFSIQKVMSTTGTTIQPKEVFQLNPITVTARPANNNRTNNNVQQLPIITVTAEQNGSAEDGYLTKSITGVGLWDKRSLQDTPYQMSIVSQDLIENTASGIEQVFKMNPTVQVSYVPTSAQSWGSIGMNIRGFSAVDNTILNGIPISSIYTSLGQDLERIEILNGLSGFLYGVGNVGGSVNYVTKRPTQERLTNLTLGSTGNQALYTHLDLGGKIDDEGTWSYRLNAFKQNGETSIENQDIDNTLISGALDWKVTDDLLVSFDASHKESQTDKLTASFSSNDSADKFDPKQGYSPDWTFSDYSQDRLGFNTLWQINDQIRLRTGYIFVETDNEYNQPYVYDNYDNTYQLNYYRLYPSKMKDHGAYIYADFDFNTYGIQHTLTLGSSGNKRKSYSTDTVREWVSLGSYTLDQLNSVPEPTYLGSSSDPMYLSGRHKKLNFMIGDDIKFNDQWSALLGLNYVKTQTDNYSTTGARSGSYDEDKITPNISLIFKPIENLTTYMTYIESLENGSIVGDDYKNKGEIFKPYVSKQYELGTKYSISENLLLSSALFRIEKANEYEDESTTPKTLTQDGMVVNQGFELTLTGKLTDNLTLVGGGTILDLNIEKGKDWSGTSLNGKKPTNTASQMAKLYAEYTIPAIEGLTLTGGAYYTGKSYSNAENTESISAYTIFDAGLRYSTKVAGYPTKFIVNATNITDKKYWKQSASFGEPRNIAFSIKTQF